MRAIARAGVPTGIALLDRARVTVNTRACDCSLDAFTWRFSDRLPCAAGTLIVSSRPDQADSRAVSPDEERRALALAQQLAEWATAELGPAVPHEVTQKDRGELVTEWDVRIERTVRDELRTAFPGHQYAGEELGSSVINPDRPTWWIDPIDGTTNFVHGIGWMSFSLGLSDRRGPVVGVVGDPVKGTVVSARRSHGAWCDGRPVRCSSSSGMAGEIVFAEWDSHGPSAGSLQACAALAALGCSLRVMGSSALSLVSAARGMAVACAIRGCEPFDVMAGVLIAREAGMQILDQQGVEGECPADRLLAISPGVLDHLQPMLMLMT